MRRPELVLILDNIRSAHNVGSLFRTADAFGVGQVICVGITPYPELPDDTRLPHVAKRATMQISKTALGAEKTVPFAYYRTINQAVTALEAAGYRLCALEQAPNSIALSDFQPPWPLALIVGHEVKGVDPSTLARVESIIEIPMLGTKESLNVAVATGIAIYALIHRNI